MTLKEGSETMANDKISAKALAKAINGESHHLDADQLFPISVSTDTRNINNGQIFFALKGDVFDAHKLVDKAANAGAGVLVIEHKDHLTKDTPYILVEDTLKALQDFSAYWRTQLTAKAIGITGSNGKTSTKDLTKAVLSQKFSTHCTKGNFNNHIGLPLTLLETSQSHETAIYEMGMNHRGEIAPLCEFSKPEIGIITSIGTAHIEHLGSQEEIAEEKADLAAALPASGTLIIPADLSHRNLVERKTKASIFTTGVEQDGDLIATDLQNKKGITTFNLTLKNKESIQVSLPLSGKHMVSNALLAAATGHLLGLSLDEIKQGLESVELTSGRLRQYQYGDITVIDDTYNANPDSVKAAALTLKDSLNESKGFIILGKMAELGEHTDSAHFEVGSFSAKLGLTVISVGPEAIKIFEGASSIQESFHFNTKENAADWIQSNIPPLSTVLFKGSRSAAMEKLMQLTYPETP